MSVTTEFSSTRKRSGMGPQAIVVQKSAPGTRLSMGGTLGGGTTIRRNVVQSTYTAPTRAQGEAAKVSKESVQNIMSTRGKEKQEMGTLNSKFAEYIDKVKYMEACNKAMGEEIERLRKMKGYTQDRVKDEYESELKEARETIDTLSKELAPLQSKILALEDKLESKDAEVDALRKQKDDLQNQVQKLSQMMGDLEGEVATLRYQLEALGKENDMLKTDVERLRLDNTGIRDDFEAAVTKQINAENERDALAEELQFQKDVYNAEVEELRELLANFKSVQPDIQKMWKSEFKECIQAIQAEYNDQLAKMTESTERRCQERIASMENAYRRDNTDAEISKKENKTLKSQLGDNKNRFSDLERENERLRRELEKLRDEFEEQCRECEEEKARLRERLAEAEGDVVECMNNLEQMKSHNLDLELEISCYRKLLEGEENSMKRVIEDQQKMQSSGAADLAGIISGGGGGRGGSSSQTSTMSESTGMVRVSRSSKCALTIAEVAQDGSFCTLQNSSPSKDFELGKWVIERKHPRGKASFQFPDKFKLGPKRSVKIYANSFGDECGDDDLVAPRSTCNTWGTGDGEYKCIDENRSEKASAKLEFGGR